MFEMSTGSWPGACLRGSRLSRFLWVLCTLLLQVEGEQPLSQLWTGRAPTSQELGRRAAHELKALLQSKGLHCDDCDKGQLVQRVLDTWDEEVLEASSPDGKVRLTKDVFMKDLKKSYKRHLKRKPEDGGHELADDEEETDSVDGPDSRFPDFSKEWREFSVKLAKGEAQTDNGQIVYEVGGQTSTPSFWDKWKMYLLMGMNISMLMCTQYLKRYKTQDDGNPRGTRAEGEVEGEEFESKKSDKTKKKKDGKKKS
eukprot:Skav209488  [mRNA]  locus=scaffold1892:199733:206945:- [translate_table: standard]